MELGLPGSKINTVLGISRKNIRSIGAEKNEIKPLNRKDIVRTENRSRNSGKNSTTIGQKQHNDFPENKREGSSGKPQIRIDLSVV